jgi:signal transduction histidine kinase
MMRVASSLTNRIFLASAALATLSLGFAFYVVNARASGQAEAELRRGLLEAAELVDLRRETLSDMFTRFAQVVADNPRLKATVDTEDPPTVQPVAEEYRTFIASDLLVITDPAGAVLGASGGSRDTVQRVAQWSHRSGRGSAFFTDPRGILQVVSVPVFVGVASPDILGRLSVGFYMDEALAKNLRQLTGSEVAFAAGGTVLASSLPPEARARLSEVAGDDITSVSLGEEEYLALARPMRDTHTDAAVDEHADAPVTLVLRSRSESLAFLRTLRNGLVGALVITLLLATILSYFVARTMTRPLSAVTTAMRDVAATGDLTRKVVLRSRAWDDEDARLLAGAFNTLTESIARFQRQAAQKERLSSLGRMSTVIAHEVRNPLMIIRASLSSLRRERVTPAELRDAVADIDEETMRLNQIVTDVLDFAKPLRFDMAEANINDICRASAAAAWAGEPKPPVSLELDPSVPPIITDSERLRTALVNILTNARHAAESSAAPGPVVVTTRRRGDRVAVCVRDAGAGITPEDMAHIFDPYFTTRRTGSGLGLPISKNIVEGLGGTIAVTSRRGEGTEIRIDLPLAAPGAAA